MDTTAPTPSPLLPPPPEHSYLSLELAIDAMQDFAKQHGYAMVLRRSKPDGKNVEKTKHIYTCDRRYDYKSIATTRLTATRGTGCKFQIKLQLSSSGDNGEDQRFWDLSVMHTEHNHGASASSSSHPVHRRRDRAPHMPHIQSMLTAGSRPNQVIASVILTDKNVNVTRKDISNLRDLNRVEYLQGRTAIQALIGELQGPDWISSY
jgi:hypothetical protein